jgi:acyl-homoserine-lactone acylase
VQCSAKSGAYRGELAQRFDPADTLRPFMPASHNNGRSPLRRLLLLVALACAGCVSQVIDPPDDAQRWQQHARNVTITRDDWGIAHVHGRTDADAVFGLIYAQAEDDFNRIETNYLVAVGRLAEAQGESALYSDLRARLYVDPDDLRQKFESSPPWLKALTQAWADGLNYFLYTHPAVRPRVLTHFEPWMPLSFSEGSIGGDIENISLEKLAAFYGSVERTEATALRDARRSTRDGSNGIAIAPSRSETHHALLWINPRTSFFFRAEAQASSDEGLNAYGAITWGQFFVYQGFNAHCGWMHTSSNVDNIDEYLETIVRKPDGLYYRYGGEERALVAKPVTVSYRTDSGMGARTFTTYRTHHGPIVRADGDHWVSVRLMNAPVKALMQSWLRTKAHNLAGFREVMELHANSSNNTLFADDEGNIAYLHANFIPKRDTRFDWSQPVDGSDPATEWQDVYSIDESPNAVNPASGWAYNTNNWPYSAAGDDSPKASGYPPYVDPGTENPRGVHVMALLTNDRRFTLDTLRDAAFDSYLPAFADLIPGLLHAYDETPRSDTDATKIPEQIDVLRRWDFRWSGDSVATTLAVYWGDELWRRTKTDPDSEDTWAYARVAAAPASEQLAALATASERLVADFGTWRMPWGEVNRFQRITAAVKPSFDDQAPSVPVAFTSSRWGSLAAFEYQPRESRGTRKLYGTSGNSFIAGVEFGARVRAKAITAGGESGDPASAHFNDQATRYSTGDLRDVYFYRDELEDHIEHEYRPGE